MRLVTRKKEAVGSKAFPASWMQRNVFARPQIAPPHSPITA